jgi:hypothetical protein
LSPTLTRAFMEPSEPSCYRAARRIAAISRNFEKRGVIRTRMREGGGGTSGESSDNRTTKSLSDHATRKPIGSTGLGDCWVAYAAWAADVRSIAVASASRPGRCQICCQKRKRATRKPLFSFQISDSIGGADRDRTGDLLNAISAFVSGHCFLRVRVI